MRFRIVILAVAFASLAVVRPPADSPRYRLTLLPVPNGCDSYSFFPHGLSGAGSRAIVGILECEGSSSYQAVVWRGEEVFDLDALGGPGSYALGISRDGATVVGLADTAELLPDGSYLSRPVVWTARQPTDLGTLGGSIGAATDVSGGQEAITGTCQAGDMDPRIGREPVRACLWTGGSVVDLGDLGGPEAVAYDRSAQGWVVGWSNTAEPAPLGNGYRWVGFLHDGSQMASLGTLGGGWSEAWSVNASGSVVGVSETNVLGPFGRLETHGFLWERGEIRDLGKLAGGYSQAWAINDQGEIVGASHSVDPAGRTRVVAALWNGGSIVNLNELVDDLGDWRLTRATAIDNAGRILVQAERIGAARVAVLEPRTEVRRQGPSVRP